MLRQTVIALLLLAVGFAAGTLVPRVSALEGVDRIVRELTGIRSEITQIRRALERR